MTTAGPSRSYQIPNPSPRHHPYSIPPSQSQAQAQAQTRPKWQTPSNTPSNPRSPTHSHAPPSPPRSRRDPSETPSLGLGIAFGGSSGGKWWDEELPAPPASLGSILDSFRRSGEGDRDLLLAILGAKKAEEERLTALIQTRLTILQARLSLHSAAANINATCSTPPPTSMSSGGSVSSNGPETPPQPEAGYMAPPPPPNTNTNTKQDETREYYRLPPPSSLLGGRGRSDHQLAPLRMNDMGLKGDQERENVTVTGRPANGLVMLLDAGMGRERTELVERD